jgi:SAM-dependent methyltransferase
MTQGLKACCAVFVLFLGLCTPVAADEAIQKDVPYVPTDEDLVRLMLTMAAVGGGDIVYDLGCGDGRIVITAVKEFGARRGVGVDIDPQRIEESEDNAKKAGVDGKVQFIRGDLFQTDFSEATVLTLYLLPEVNLRLRPRILSELKPGTRVVSHDFDMGDWVPDREGSQENSMVFFWIVPANVSGSWRWTDPDGSACELSLTQEFQDVTGTALVGGAEREVDGLLLRGDRLVFGIAGKGGLVGYEGRVRGDTIEGTAKGEPWSARRSPDTATPLDPGFKATVLPALEGQDRVELVVGVE